MTLRKDRSVSFFGEDNYQTLFDIKNSTLNNKKCISNVFKKIFCGKYQEQEEEEDLYPNRENNISSLRHKYKSAMICSTFNSNKRTDVSLFCCTNTQKTSDSLFFNSCCKIPKKDFFILGKNHFNVIARIKEEDFKFCKKQDKNTVFEEFFIRKLKKIKGDLISNFHLLNNDKENDIFCSKVLFIFNFISFYFRLQKQRDA